MPDEYKEVVIVIVSAITLFLVLAGIIILFLFRYQKKRFQHQHHVLTLQQQFHEEILQARLEIQESTFNNISSEIHDNVGQLLSLAKVQLNIMEHAESLERNMLADIKESVSKAMTELRDIAKSLSGEKVLQAGLVKAIEMEAERINRTQILRISIKVSGEAFNLNEHKQLILFRIIQECFQNTLKHAQATTVSVSLNYAKDTLALSVDDNGKGFDVQKSNTMGMGLQNIISRAHIIGATATITSKVSEGTLIELIITNE